MTPEQHEELKPCPFCGGSVSLEKYTKDSNMGPRSWWGVKCRNTINLGGTCAIEQNPSGSPEAAIERWNRRAQVEALTVPQIVAFGCTLIGHASTTDGMDDKEATAWVSQQWEEWSSPTIPAIPGTKEGA